MRHLSVLLVPVLFVSIAASGQQVQCGGTERWAVKVGTDSQAGAVASAVDQPTPIDLHSLIALSEPTRPNDNVTRVVPDETHVFVIRAFMLKFKLEANDSDYHIVVTDDTHQFTDTHGNSTGHSVIAEIPDPNCLEGKDHNFPGTTPFANGITAARALMDSRFPNAAKDGTFNDVGLPVEITAVGFFDRAHGQIGRATNNIELHPILRLCFLDTATPQCSTGTTAGGSSPVNVGTVVQTANAPFSWTLSLHGSADGPMATLELPFQGTGAGKLQLNFFAAAVPADSFDSTTKLVVKNLDRSMLGATISALNSAGTLTVTTSSTGQPVQFQHEVQFTSKVP
jgi:hypothetical protein